MSKITEIQAIPFRLPMKSSLNGEQTDSMTAVEYVLIRLITDTGHVGLAEAPPRPTVYGETVQSIQAIIQHHLAPMLIGQSLADGIEPLSKKLSTIANNHTAKGALDICLHEAWAAYQGKHLLDYLAPLSAKVKVSYTLGLAELDKILAEAKAVYEQGVRVFKVKIGQDWAADKATIQALHHEFGDAVSLYADGNEGLSLNDVSTQLRQLVDIGVMYVEEPLPIERIKQRKSLCEANILPIVADNSTFTIKNLTRELDFRTFDVLNIKTARSGYTQSKQMLALACQHGKGVMVASQASSTLGTVRAAIFAGQAGIDYPCELTFFLKLKDDIMTDSIRLVDGYIDLESLRNIALDETKLEQALRPGD